MAKYDYLEDVLQELRTDRDATFDKEMLDKIVLSIEEWLRMVQQLDQIKNQHYAAIKKQQDLSRISSKGANIEVSSWGARAVLAKKSRAGLRTIDEIVEHFKKGYELIHRIRELLTNQDISYSILYGTRKRKDGEKPLLEGHLTLEQVLEYSRATFSDIKTVDVDTEFSNTISLSFTNADARKAISVAEKGGVTGISTAITKRGLWDSLVKHAEVEAPNANYGQLYEVYATLTKIPRYQKIEFIGHYRNQANTKNLANALIKEALSNNDAGWQKGDIALEQLKSVFNATANLMDSSTIKKVLRQIHAALKTDTQKNMIDALTQVFTVNRSEFNLEVDKMVNDEAIAAIEEKIKAGNIKFDIK